MAETERFEEQVAALEATLAGLGGASASLDGELRRMGESFAAAGREAASLSAGIGGGLRRAFDGLVFDGMRLSDALRIVARSMVDSVYRVAMRPVQTALGGAVTQVLGGLLPFETGGAFTQGRVMPFAQGGIVTGPVAFPMRGGRGLMGEAGPEAILPLARGADGRLGVRAGAAGRPVNVTVNVTTPDVAGFERSQAQIAAQMARALARGQRNG